MLDKYRHNWYDLAAICAALSLSERAARSRLEKAPAALVRQDDQQTRRGRPRMLYHYSALPELAAAHKAGRLVAKRDPAETSLPARKQPAADAPAADDLALAEMRLRAVLEYEEMAAASIREQASSREQAAIDVAAAWRRRPKSRTVKVAERLPGGHTRTRSETVTVGKFAPKTLRRWAAIYRNARALGNDAVLLALCPARKGRVGRARLDIPEADLEFVRALAASNARADVAKAVAYAQDKISPEARGASLATWRRRLSELDPRGGLRDLIHSRARFRARHTPDVEIDWNRIAYNARWELDDVQKDWYGYSTEADRLIRPYGYAIIRVRTRQWVAFAASETKPTSENVRELLGFAMCNPFGGIPDVIKFERGTVACSPDLEALLDMLGVRVSRTSMDGGASLPGSVADVASGHFQGKGIVERQFRTAHGHEWLERNQVGTDERSTAPARMERIKALAKREAAEGRFLMARQPEEWFPVFQRTMDAHNNRPHSALPLIVDPETGKNRHMTPNEQAAALQDTPIRLMDERLLPRFVSKGEVVPVTRNGIRLNNRDYGRFDEQLQQHKAVTVFASRDFPAVAYVNELGRCLTSYEKAAPGDWSQFERKRAAEKRFRNQAEALHARLIESGRPGVMDMLMAAGNPTPDRAIAETVCPPEMLEQAQGLRRGIDAERSRRTRSDARFLAAPDPDRDEMPPAAGEPSRAKRGGGLLARADDYAAHVATLSDPQPEEDSIW